MEVILALGVVLVVTAIVLTFARSDEADSPMGDAMILGIILLAVPLWPITLPLWILYLLVREPGERSVSRRPGAQGGDRNSKP